MDSKPYGLRDKKPGFWIRRRSFTLAVVLLFSLILIILGPVFRPASMQTTDHEPAVLSEPLFLAEQVVSSPVAEQEEAWPLLGVNVDAAVDLDVDAKGSVKPAPIEPPAVSREPEKEEDAFGGPGDKALAPPELGDGDYDYSKPVPLAAAAVPGDYFQDTVFIGDSRTAGFQMFGGPQEATYYTAKGLKVDTIFTKKVVNTSNGNKITIMEALRQKPFQKAYLMLGINELGWVYSDLFIKKYSEIIAEIKSIAPQAQIYIQSLLPVSEKRSQSDSIFNNANIDKYNKLIQQMAAENNLYYLDVAQCVADQGGNLAEEASTDGIHLNKAYCELWCDYLKRHYVPERDKRGTGESSPRPKRDRRIVPASQERF